MCACLPHCVLPRDGAYPAQQSPGSADHSRNTNFSGKPPGPESRSSKQVTSVLLSTQDVGGETCRQAVLKEQRISFLSPDWLLPHCIDSDELKLLILLLGLPDSRIHPCFVYCWESRVQPSICTGQVLCPRACYTNPNHRTAVEGDSTRSSLHPWALLECGHSVLNVCLPSSTSPSPSERSKSQA